MTSTTPESTTPPVDSPIPAPQETTETPTDATESSSEQAAEQAPESKPRSGFKESLRSIADGFTERANKFIREHFKGEHVEGKPVEMNKTEITKAVGVGMIGVAASLGGMKSFADLPRWFAQKYYTKQEQQRIKQSLDTAVHPDRARATLKLDSGEDAGWEIVEEFDDGKIRVAKTIEGQGRVAKIVEASQIEREVPPSPVEIKKRRLERAVMESKYLSPEKKKELLQKLQDTVETYDHDLETYEKQRNEKVAELLDEAIQTRVKGTTALKETLNTAMLATGLNVLRGAAYGAVALFERAVKVKQEMAKGERAEGFAKELVVKGFTETWDDLRFKTGDTKTKKAMNFAKALGTVARFAGFTGLAIGEMSGSGGPSAAIEKALEAFEQKGVAGAAADNVSTHFERLGNIATLGLLKEETTPQAETSGTTPVSAETAAASASEAPTDTTAPIEAPVQETPTETAEPTGDTVESEAEVAAESVEFEPLELTAGKPLPDELSPEELAQEVAAEQEAPLTSEELKAGTVQRGDGVIRVVQRQLKLNPEKYGYTGDVSDKKAVATWVRKTAFGITKQAGLVHKDGWLGVRGKAIDNMALGISQGPDGKMQVNFYDAKSGAQMSVEDMRAKGFVHDYKKPTAELPLETTDSEKPDTETESPPVVNEEAPTAETSHGLPEVTDETQVVDAGEAPSGGLPEIGPDTTVVDADHPPLAEPVPEIPPVVTPPETETVAPLETFKSPQGAAQFKYEGGKITGVALDYQRTGADIDRAAERFGTSEWAVHKAYVRGVPMDQMWKANAPAKEFLDTMERETRMEALMRDMASKGLKDTPEYKHIEQQAGRLKGVIKQTFRELGMNDHVDQVDRAALTVKEETPPDVQTDRLKPPAAVEPPPTEAPTDAVAEPEMPQAEQPSPELTKGPGGLEFTSEYTPEEQAKIADYIHRGRLENAATAKLLAEYQSKYGDRPQFGAFKTQVEQQLQNQENHLARVVQQAAGKAEGKPVIEIQGGMTPERAAGIAAENAIAQADAATKLTSVLEKSSAAFDDLDKK